MKERTLSVLENRVLRRILELRGRKLEESEKNA
jgi:hypothetical protein